MTDPWILSTTEPHAELLYLSNGYLGTGLDWDAGISGAGTPCACYVRGIYDVAADGIDRLALLPCWNRVRYAKPVEVEEYERRLDLYRACLDTRLTLREERGLIRIDQRIILSRHDRHLAAVRLVVRPEFDGAIAFRADLERPASGNFSVVGTGYYGGAMWMSGCVPAYSIGVGLRLSWQADGWNIEPISEENQTASVSLTIQAQRGRDETLIQFARVVGSEESADPVSAANAPVPPYEQMQQDHFRVWAGMWKTDIEIEGDPEVQQFARAGLFYLWSTVWPGDHWSIAPMGLSSNGYNGHIFWDAELWMYPSLLITRPELGYSCVAYRERTIAAARDRARSNGHRGAQFPWEAAYTGAEMTPHWAETRDFQLHITADVAIGQWWYYLTTGDGAWLAEHGFPIIRECAEYWVSRVEHNEDADRYEVSDVVCADEYAAHVNNDAFTNAAIHVALLIAERAARVVGQEPSPEWRTIAERMHVPYDPARGLHLEFDGYDGQVTKQADVELLAYPLEYTRDREQVARDLDYYGGVIDPEGPAMSFSVYAVLHAQLGRGDEAYRYLLRSFIPNTHRPFWAFSETPTNGEYFFCTGVGGALQALLFGFTGLRQREGTFVLKPTLPSHWKAMRLRNLCLLGRHTDIEVDRERVVVRRAGITIQLNCSADRIESVQLVGPADSATVQLCDEAGIAQRTVAGTELLSLPRDDRTGDLRLRVACGEDVLLDITLTP